MDNKEIAALERIKGAWRRLIGDKRRRFLLLAGAVLLLLGLVYRLYPWYEEMMGGGTDMALLEKKVAKYSQVVSGKDVLKTRLLSLQRSLNQAEAGLLVGDTEALAAVNVQNALNEIALAGGVEIKSMQVMTPSGQDEETAFYVSVPVQFSVTVTIRQLKDILYKIETFPRIFLTVQWIRISPVRGGDGRIIRCDMAVSGIMKKRNNG